MRVIVFLALVVVLGCTPHSIYAFVAPRSTSKQTELFNSIIEINKKNVILPDYLITDSKDLIDRPPLGEFLVKPRNVLPLSLVGVGVVLCEMGVTGQYNNNYLSFLVLGSILGMACSLLELRDALPPYDQSNPANGVSPNPRCGVIDDAVIHAYSGVYTAGASWLALRASYICPDWLMRLDVVVGPIAAIIFIFSLFAPVVTLLKYYFGIGDAAIESMVGLVRRRRCRMTEIGTVDSDDACLPSSLSELELFRAQSLVGIGIVGCIYTPLVLSFLCLGQDWWIRVQAVYPGQPWAEASTAFIGVLATQACMLGHRAAKAGVATFSLVVPVFTAVSLVLGILPCAVIFKWFGDNISFFEYYKL
mmetsp:Transcript_9129/g.14159  ORF Transcript_9129/g.14159 Transcript_9129/m.14159 type:complete len:362 (+) Transcript_9129:549-1634(+)|eukprot:CAMPEP_0118699578 /NCGR_PEP_ID=MMETSP0800-20121206/15988_1 /TAXON_ID=210618 ORGANISM="Striatella unipunctata, Strain CCMP2910" /NCGR_SAMPLE_ID=MMETSP0800 /ASSEMBLY_ACC=CAM_ASM_000638 /LENGTH=361 /DNA_ID=CAMNT_0006599833 /DNA_START=629 /DNA_END=1714 /DNA_ORIENTATION=+